MQDIKTWENVRWNPSFWGQKHPKNTPKCGGKPREEYWNVEQNLTFAWVSKGFEHREDFVV